MQTCSNSLVKTLVALAITSASALGLAADPARSAATTPAGWVFTYVQSGKEQTVVVDQSQLTCGADTRGRSAEVYLGNVGNTLAADASRGGAIKLRDVLVQRAATDEDLAGLHGKPRVISAVQSSPASKLMTIETVTGEKWITWVGDSQRPVFDCYVSEPFNQFRPIPAVFESMPNPSAWRFLGVQAYDAAGLAAFKVESSRIAKADQDAREKAASATAASLAQWRKAIASGDQTSCGLVVEVKSKVVSVQTRDRGLVWMQREQLRQPGNACDI